MGFPLVYLSNHNTGTPQQKQNKNRKRRHPTSGRVCSLPPNAPRRGPRSGRTSRGPRASGSTDYSEACDATGPGLRYGFDLVWISQGFPSFLCLLCEYFNISLLTQTIDQGKTESELHGVTHGLLGRCNFPTKSGRELMRHPMHPMHPMQATPQINQPKQHPYSEATTLSEIEQQH